jgi:hypothetical protein
MASTKNSRFVSLEGIQLGSSRGVKGEPPVYQIRNFLHPAPGSPGNLKYRNSTMLLDS